MQMRYYDREGKEISHYWWRRAMRNWKYARLRVTPVVGGWVSTSWIGAAEAAEAPPLIFCTRVVVYGREDIFIWTHTEKLARKAHDRGCVTAAMQLAG